MTVRSVAERHHPKLNWIFSSRSGAGGRDLTWRRFGDDRISLDFHLDLGSFLQLDLLTVRIGEAVRNT